MTHRQVSDVQRYLLSSHELTNVALGVVKQMIENAQKIAEDDSNNEESESDVNGASDQVMKDA
jgi:hypothetical protein